MMLSVFLLLAVLFPVYAATPDFPVDFKWCVATSAHQIEGNNAESDWWDWEQIPGKIKNGEKSGVACNHWNRLEEDTQLLKDLHVRQYRFSVEWAKIQPREGQWNAEAIEHYRKEISLLQQSNIEPLITLHHFTLPRWVREKGGWEWDGASSAFAQFAAFVYSEVGDGVQDWITFNEPMVHLVGGYLAGLTPPGEKRALKDVLPPLRGLLRAHQEAYHALHRLAQGQRRIRVGMAHHLRIFDPGWSFNPLDIAVANFLDSAFNWALPDAFESGRLKLWFPFALRVDEGMEGLERTQDFIGVNYYSRDLVSFSPGEPLGFKLKVNPDSPKNDMGWEIYPEGFYRILKSIQKRFPEKSILVTENGIADASDQKRRQFLEDHLAALHRAMQEGAPVESYCYWSFLDNFEWIDGFGPRFGLYEVDYSTQQRRLRDSGRYFSGVAGRH